MLALQLLSAAFGKGCMPSKVDDRDESEYNAICLCHGGLADQTSFTLMDETAALVEEPPKSLNRGPGPLTEGLGIQTPRFGVVPKRINFAKHHTDSLKSIAIDLSSLTDAAWERRCEAVAGLGSCYLGRHPAEFNQDAANLILPSLRAALRDEHWKVRARAAESLSDLGPEAVWLSGPVLWEACSDP